MKESEHGAVKAQAPVMRLKGEGGERRAEGDELAEFGRLDKQSLDHFVGKNSASK
jgi:hypothetical protein